jgi:putative Ig domain-containing protein/galactose oxidase-like protein
MKTRTLSSTAAILLLAVLAILVYLPAKAQQAGEKKPSHYSLTGPDDPGKIFRQVAGACTPKGGQCASVLLPCCPGLQCVALGNRAFCETIPPPPSPPTINTVPPPSAGAATLPYSFTFSAQNGILPLSWTETGTLPPGLVFAASGRLSGTPSTTGSFPISIDVTDSAGRSATPQAFTIHVFSHGFKLTGKMTTVRTSHTTTLLPSGKVLVVGGFSSAGGLKSAELFNPVTRAFSSTGSMEIGRFQHTATLLTNDCGAL